MKPKLKDIKRRWPGYESCAFYWHNQKAQDVLDNKTNTPGSVYVVWARNTEHLHREFPIWLRWLPTPILWRMKIWLLTH